MIVFKVLLASLKSNYMNKYTIVLLILILGVIVVGFGVVMFANQSNQTNQPTQPEVQRSVDNSQNQPKVITSDIDTGDWQVYNSPFA